MIVIIVTVIAAGIVHTVKTMEPLKNERLFEFPIVIGQWHGQDIPMTEYVYQALGTRYVFLRNYYSSTYPNLVNLSVVWSDDTHLSAFHAPEECLGGVGNTVKEMGTLKVMLDKEYEIGKLVSELNGKMNVVLYYYDVSGHITLSQKDIRLRVLAKRIRLQRANASFVRIMAPVNQSEEETTNVLNAFLRDIHPVLTSYINVKLR